ncbi:MAG: sugar ABC transporter permease [Ruminococcaceae bacterium]|nr:sugar ABC transporter permease [Oscillospiraceae bacterium]
MQNTVKPVKKRTPRPHPPEKNKAEQCRDRARLRELRRTRWFILPSFLGVAVFFLLPFFVVFYYSLIDNPVTANFVGLDNFFALLKNIAFRRAASNTAMFSAIAVPLAVVLPLLFAILLMQKLPLKSFFRTVLISPYMVPIASVVLIWEVLFHYNGMVNEWIMALGGEAIDWFKSDYSQITIVLLYLWKNIGYNMILFMAALAGIPRDIIEAAQLDGAGALRTFFRIKLPYLSSTILFVTILSLINSFKVFREVYLLTGEYPYDSLYMLQHFMNNTFVSLDYQKLSSAAILMAIVMVIIIGLLFLADARLGRDIEE